MPSRSTEFRHAKAKAEGRVVRKYMLREAKLHDALITWEATHGVTRCCACLVLRWPRRGCDFCAALRCEPDEVEVAADED